MKPIGAVIAFVACLPIGAVLAPAPAEAFDIVPGPLIDLVEAADVIVDGVELQGDKFRCTIRVRETLKGPAARTIEASPYSEMGIRICNPGDEGLFFLKLKDGEYAPVRSDARRPRKEKARTKTLLRMIADPKRFMSSRASRRDRDFIGLLGRRFGAYDIEPATSALQMLLGNGTAEPIDPDGLPWRSPGRYARCVQIAVHDANRVDPDRSEGTRPPRIRDDFERFIVARVRWARYRDAPFARNLPDPLCVVLDTDTPRTVGKLSRDEAQTFLQRRLADRDPAIVSEALSALTSMRDSESVPLAIALLGHAHRGVRTEAATLLGNSRDGAAVRPLIAQLDAAHADGPVREGEMPAHFEELRAAEALAVIGDPQALPALQRAVAAGKYGSGRAAGALCDVSCVDGMLALAETGSVESWSAMFFLVERSNHPVEPWMGRNASGTTWRTWWQEHQATFRIVR
jgi:hypothetical protein